MPIARFQMPDGRIGRFEVPEGTTPEEAQAMIGQLVANQNTQQPPKDAPRGTETPAEAVAAHPYTRFALGAASPVIGAAQLAERLPQPIQALIPAGPALAALGRNLDIPTLEKMKRAGMAETGDSTDMAGFLGSIFSPAFLGAAKAIPGGLSYLQKIATGTAIGGIAGLSAPVTNEKDFAKEKMLQTGIGTLAGGTVPAVAPAVTGVANAGYKALIEPWANPAAIKGRAYLEAAGDKANEIIALLRQNKEIVPGSTPTAAEAAAPAARAEFAAMQRQAERANPSPYVGRADEQNAARLAAIRSVGQTPQAIEQAAKQRGTNASANYGTVENDLIIPSDPKITALLERPSMTKAVARAKELAAERGAAFPKNGEAISVGNLQDVKMALDDMAKNPERFSIGASEVAAINRTRAEFINWLNSQSPGWQKAREQYAADSMPINQMQIGQYLEQKLTPALSEEAKQRSGVFAQALRDAPQTIKKATGAPRFETLVEALTPEQLAVVNSVRDDLARSARTEQLASKGGIAAPTAEVTERLPNLLHRGAMIANAIVSRLEGKINKKLASEIAVEMLNPPKVAESLAAAKNRAAMNAALAAEIDRRVLTVPGAAVAGSQ